MGRAVSEKPLRLLPCVVKHQEKEIEFVQSNEDEAALVEIVIFNTFAYKYTSYWTSGSDSTRSKVINILLETCTQRMQLNWWLLFSINASISVEA